MAMTVRGTINNLMVVGKGKSPGKDNRTYYNIAVVNDNGEAGTLSGSENVYNSITDIMKPYNFEIEYSDTGKWQFFRLSRVIPDFNKK